MEPLVKNDAAVFGILMLVLAFVFLYFNQQQQNLEEILRSRSRSVDVLPLTLFAQFIRHNFKGIFAIVYSSKIVSLTDKSCFNDIEH